MTEVGCVELLESLPKDVQEAGQMLTRVLILYEVIDLDGQPYPRLCCTWTNADVMTRLGMLHGALIATEERFRNLMSDSDE